MKKFGFGEKVRINGKLSRAKAGNKRYWFHTSVPKTDAIFLGYRTLSNGVVEYESYGYYGDEGGSYIFNPGDYIAAALVCEEGRKPRYVLLEDVEHIHTFSWHGGGVIGPCKCGVIYEEKK